MSERLRDRLVSYSAEVFLVVISPPSFLSVPLGLHFCS